MSLFLSKQPRNKTDFCFRGRFRFRGVNEWIITTQFVLGGSSSLKYPDLCFWACVIRNVGSRVFGANFFRLIINKFPKFMESPAYAFRTIKLPKQWIDLLLSQWSFSCFSHQTKTDCSIFYVSSRFIFIFGQIMKKKRCWQTFRLSPETNWIKTVETKSTFLPVQCWILILFVGDDTDPPCHEQSKHILGKCLETGAHWVHFQK